MRRKNILLILLSTSLSLYPIVNTSITVSAATAAQSSPLSSEAYTDSETVDIPDLALRTVIQQSLGKDSTSPITKDDLKSIERLSYNNSSNTSRQPIEDLTGIQYCTNLRYLTLTNNKISDISMLKDLTSLTNLYLGNNPISDFSPLTKLPELNHLNLIGSKIQDLSFISQIKSLKYLDLDYCDISDISALDGLSSLRSLSLDGNHITDLSPLSNYSDTIDYLGMRDQVIKLEKQECGTILTIPSPINDIDKTPMKPQKISNNGVYDEKTNTITWNNLKSDTTKLTVYYSKDNDEENSKHLTALPIQYSCTVSIPVNVTYSKNTAVTIEDATLKYLILKKLGKTSNEEITLKDMSSITELNLANKDIENINGLQYCDNLKTLDLSNNKISNISYIANLKSLRSANLKGNRIADISCLYNTSNFRAAFDLRDQYIVLAPATCDGNHSIQNIISDDCIAAPTEISNGGKYQKSFDTIYWNGLKGNTTVFYCYSKNISKYKAWLFDTPSLNYSCKVTQSVNVIN